MTTDGRKLFDYQHIGVNHLRGYGKAGLFAAMGVGKTPMSLAALGDRHLPVVITAPIKVVREMWRYEAPAWRPDLKWVVVDGTKAQREEAMRTPADGYLVGRDSTFQAMPDFCQNRGVQTLIIDELSGFKDRETARWSAANTISHLVPYTWGLTGTPNAMGYMDLWAQIFLLDKGKRLGRYITTYRNNYFTRTSQKSGSSTYMKWELVRGAEEEIREKISDICLSMRSETYRSELPENLINKVMVPLPDKVMKQYRQMEREYVLDLTDAGGELHYSVHAGAKRNALRQILSGFVYSQETEGAYDELHQEKVERLAEIVDEAQGEQVLVFYHFKAEAEMIRRRLGAKVHMVNDKGAVERWNDHKAPVLLAHPASAAYGLNLQHGGHIAVWTTMTDSQELWEQANARLCRHGQKEQVITHVLMARGTIDEPILATRMKLADEMQALMEYLETVQAIRRS